MIKANQTSTDTLTDEQWKTYERDGYLKLGKTLSDQELIALRQRIDDFMLGKADVDYTKFMMQREAGEGYDLGTSAAGFKGATLNYRKIGDMENDPLFLSYMSKPLFGSICQRIYGKERIACFRAMFMNKPAKNGSSLGYHQDQWDGITDRDPLVTIWTALDDATTENGCLKIFPGTQKQIIKNDPGKYSLNKDQIEQLHKQVTPVYLEVKAGESVLLHNWTVHGSDGNVSDKTRRALTVCYIDADTVSLIGRTFKVLFETAL